MVQIVLILPGSTDYDEQGRIQGTLDIPLNAEGSAKVQQIGEELKQFDISVIYTAPNQAAWQTGSAIAQTLGTKVKKVDSLKNLDHGLWQGMEIDEIRRKHPKVFRQWQEQPEIICPPEGEMLRDAQERVKTALTKLLRKQKQGTVGLVVSEPLTSLVRSFLTDCALGDMWKLGESCGCWELLQIQTPGMSYRGVQIVKEEKGATHDSIVPIGLN
jgi:probable phosphoglycerate mutase